MKKNNKTNKIVILSIIGLLLLVCVVIFILNYTKDSSSFSLLEKNWINKMKHSPALQQNNRCKTGLLFVIS